MWNSEALSAQTFSCDSPESRGRQVRGGGSGLEPKPSVKQQRGSPSHGEMCPGFLLSSPQVRGAGKQVVMEALQRGVKSVCSARGKRAENGLFLWVHVKQSVCWRGVGCFAAPGDGG